VWCSQVCRGDLARPSSRKMGRPRKYRNDEERRTAKTRQQRDYRSRPAVEKTLCIQSETKDLQTQKSPLSHYTLIRQFPALEMGSKFLVWRESPRARAMQSRTASATRSRSSCFLPACRSGAFQLFWDIRAWASLKALQSVSTFAAGTAGGGCSQRLEE